MRQLKKLPQETLATFDASIILIGSTAGSFINSSLLSYLCSSITHA